MLGITCTSCGLLKTFRCFTKYKTGTTFKYSNICKLCIEKQKTKNMTKCDNCNKLFLKKYLKYSKQRGDNANICMDCYGVMLYKEHNREKEPIVTENNPNLKWCSKCGEHKDKSEFYTCTNTEDKLFKTCKSCCYTTKNKQFSADSKKDNIHYFNYFGGNRI